MKFENYTKHNKVIKSLQVELVPVGNTRVTIERDHTIEEDMERVKAAKVVKEIADSFYRELLDEFAKTASFDWDNLYQLYTQKKYDQTKCTEYIEAVEKMKDTIAKSLTNYANEYIRKYVKENGESDSGINMFSAKFVDILIPCYIKNHEEYQSINDIDKYMELLKGTATATFKKYFNGYEKIFCNTGHGSVASRMIENFEIVCNNIAVYQTNQNLIPDYCEYEEFLDISVMNQLLGQHGVFLYNEMISGSYDSNGNRIRDGYNIDVNLLMQANKDIHLLKMRKAKKQILSVQEKAFHIDKIDNMNDFQLTLKEFVKIAEEENKIVCDTINKIGNVYNRRGIFIKSASLTTVSNMYDEWNSISQIVLRNEEDLYIADYLAKKGKIKTLTKTDKARIEKKVKSKAYSLAELETMLGNKLRDETLTEVIQKCLEKNISSEMTAKSEMASILNKTEKLTTDETRKLRIYLDSVLKVCSYGKFFLTEQRDENTPYDDEFAENIVIICDKASILNDYYNKMRNFITKKINDKDDRVALCFGRAAHFEQMWKNKQEGKFGNIDAALLEKDGIYYYIVPAAKNTSKLNFPILDSGTENDYHYLFTQKGGKLSMFGPSLTFKSSKALEEYANHGYNEKFEIPCGAGFVKVSKEFFDKYENKLFRTDREFLNEVLDLYRELIRLHPGFSNVDLSSLKDNDEYPNLGVFCNEVDAMNFTVMKKFLEADKVDNAVERGDLLMFRLSSQDLYKDEERKKNKYAILLTEAFHCMETGEASILINNSPNIYYRKALIPSEDKHPVGSVLLNKKTDEGKHIPDEVYLSLYEYVNGRKTKEALSYDDLLYLPHVVTKISDREHIKDKHYTREMFYMQISYTINKDVAEELTAQKLNLKVRKDMRENGCNIMSVLRGTDNLLYYYICTPDGKKLESGPLNVVGDTNYLDKLETIGRIKRINQKDWFYEETVAKLKDTYLGMITREIAKKALAMNCIICIDWISDKVKDKHARFDANVYKKFEAKLCSTLSCYYDVTKKSGEPGSLTNPLQLALVDGGTHQNGIIFYTSSAYLKNISPCGFVSSLIDTYGKNSVTSKLNFLSKMRKISYNPDEQVFEYEFTISELGSFLSPEELKAFNGADDVWTVMTRKTRSRYDRIKKVRYDYDGTKVLKEIFKKNNHTSEVINLSELNTEEINALYDTFILYVNGYYPKEDRDSSCYFSPVEKWDSIGKIAYDEMATKNLALKGCMIYNKIINLNDDDASYVDAEKIEWLNFLRNSQKAVENK